MITLLFARSPRWGSRAGDFAAATSLLSLIISLMVIPPVVLVVPLFLLGAELNLINTFRLVIVIYVGLMLPFSVYMLRPFFRTIPRALIEAADGRRRELAAGLPARGRCRSPALRWSRSRS